MKSTGPPLRADALAGAQAVDRAEQVAERVARLGVGAHARSGTPSRPQVWPSAPQASESSRVHRDPGLQLGRARLERGVVGR